GAAGSFHVNGAGLQPPRAPWEGQPPPHELRDTLGVRGASHPARGASVTALSGGGSAYPSPPTPRPSRPPGVAGCRVVVAPTREPPFHRAPTSPGPPRPP